MKETLTKEKEAKQYGWSILWATKPNRHRTALVLWIGFCQTLSGQAIITLYVARTLRLFVSEKLTDSLTLGFKKSYYTSILKVSLLTFALDTSRESS